MNFIDIVQIITAVTLTGLILIQSKGTGFGRSLSNTSFTRRGLEKLVFKLTFVVSGIFIITSILNLFA